MMTDDYDDEVPIMSLDDDGDDQNQDGTNDNNQVISALATTTTGQEEFVFGQLVQQCLHQSSCYLNQSLEFTIGRPGENELKCFGVLPVMLLRSKYIFDLFQEFKDQVFTDSQCRHFLKNFSLVSPTSVKAFRFVWNTMNGIEPKHYFETPTAPSNIAERNEIKEALREAVNARQARHKLDNHNGSNNQNGVHETNDDMNNNNNNNTNTRHNNESLYNVNDSDYTDDDSSSHNENKDNRDNNKTSMDGVNQEHSTKQEEISHFAALLEREREYKRNNVLYGRMSETEWDHNFEVFQHLKRYLDYFQVHCAERIWFDLFLSLCNYCPYHQCNTKVDNLKKQEKQNQLVHYVKNDLSRTIAANRREKVLPRLLQAVKYVCNQCFAADCTRSISRENYQRWLTYNGFRFKSESRMTGEERSKQKQLQQCASHQAARMIPANNLATVIQQRVTKFKRDHASASTSDFVSPWIFYIYIDDARQRSNTRFQCTRLQLAVKLEINTTKKRASQNQQEFCAEMVCSYATPEDVAFLIESPKTSATRFLRRALAPNEFDTVLTEALIWPIRRLLTMLNSEFDLTLTNHTSLNFDRVEKRLMLGDKF